MLTMNLQGVLDRDTFKSRWLIWSVNYCNVRPAAKEITSAEAEVTKVQRARPIPSFCARRTVR